MKESLHKNLAKRSLTSGNSDRKDLRLTSASDMISYTKSGYGKSLWTKDMNIEVIVLDYYKNIASVKVITKHYYEYLHLAKADKKWVIVNAIYEKNSQ
jgi:Putative lumazine-binding